MDLSVISNLIQGTLLMRSCHPPRISSHEFGYMQSCTRTLLTSEPFQQEDQVLLSTNSLENLVPLYRAKNLSGPAD